jgi:hypothetical protein
LRRYLPDSAQDGTQILGPNDQIYQYYAGLDLWHSIGALPQYDTAGLYHDGLVTPQAMATLEDLGNNNYPYLKANDNCYYSLLRVDRFLDLHIVGGNNLVANGGIIQIEVDSTAIQRYAISTLCPGPRGQAGLAGPDGRDGDAGSPEQVFFPTVQGKLLTLNCPVPTPLDTVVSVRLSNGQEATAILLRLDGSWEETGNALLDRENSTVELTQGVLYLSLIHATQFWEGNWQVRARQTGPQGLSGAAGNNFIALQYSSVPAVQLLNAVTAMYPVGNTIRWSQDHYGPDNFYSLHLRANYDSTLIVNHSTVRAIGESFPDLWLSINDGDKSKSLARWGLVPREGDDDPTGGLGDLLNPTWQPNRAPTRWDPTYSDELRAQLLLPFGKSSQEDWFLEGALLHSSLSSQGLTSVECCDLCESYKIANVDLIDWNCCPGDGPGSGSEGLWDGTMYRRFWSLCEWVAEAKACAPSNGAWIGSHRLASASVYHVDGAWRLRLTSYDANGHPLLLWSGIRASNNDPSGVYQRVEGGCLVSQLTVIANCHTPVCPPPSSSSSSVVPPPSSRSSSSSAVPSSSSSVVPTDPPAPCPHPTGLSNAYSITFHALFREQDTIDGTKCYNYACDATASKTATASGTNPFSWAVPKDTPPSDPSLILVCVQTFDNGLSLDYGYENIILTHKCVDGVGFWEIQFDQYGVCKRLFRKYTGNSPVGSYQVVLEAGETSACTTASDGNTHQVCDGTFPDSITSVSVS